VLIVPVLLDKFAQHRAVVEEEIAGAQMAGVGGRIGGWM